MRRNQKGFTLMELMVVIVIVAILAAVAVPLYINYVKDARRTEAKAAIGALATSMEEYYLNTGAYLEGDIALLWTPINGRLPSNLSETTVLEIRQHWDVEVGGAGGQAGYSLTLSGVADTPYQGLVVTYTYTRGVGGVMMDEPPPQNP